jgi:hypothetical protein
MTESSNPATEYLWRARPATTEIDPEEAGTTRKLLLALVATGLAIGSLLGVASWFRAHPYPVLLPLFRDTAGPRSGPVIGQVRRDAAAIGEGRWFSRAIGRGPAVDAGQLPATLDALAGVRSDETLVVVLCSPARIGLRSTSAAEEAEVFVMPGGPAERSAGWRPLRDVLGALDRSPARRVLLLLDVMRPLVDPARGQLADDTTARVQADLAELTRLGSGGRLSVFCAADVGQVSWASEVWGRSVFLAYAEEGLNGWADVDPVTGDRDSRVTFDELVRYVTPRVERWAVRCRGVRQTPVVLGSRDDFSVAPRRRGPIVPRSSLSEDRAYPPWLEEGWTLRDRWKGESAARFAPWALRRLEAALLHAEAAWRGGGDPDRIRTDLAADQGAATRDFEANRSFPHPVPRSLALALALGEQPDDRIAQAMTRLLQDRAAPAEGLKPEELAAARGKQLAEFQKAAQGSTEFALAWAVFQAAAAAVRPTPADLVFFDGLLRDRQPDPLYVETWLLRRLADLARSSAPGAWPADVVQLALEAARRGEAAQGRPRSFTMIRPWLDAAARARHLGEIALFSPGYAPAEESERRLRHAVELCEAIAGAQAIAEQARDLRDSALGMLPAALTLVEADRTLDPTWETAVRATIELDDLLSGGDRQPPAVTLEPAVGELLRLVAPIRSRMEDLERRLGPLRKATSAVAVKDLVALAQSVQADATTWRQIDAALATPLLAAKDRAALWAAGRDLERRLLELVLGSEPDAADRRDTGRRSDEGDQGRSLASEATQRAARSIAMLRLAGQDPKLLERLEEDRVRVERTGADWAELGEALRMAWLEPLTASPDGIDLSRRDRMARVVPLEFGGVLLGRWSSDPVLDRRASEWTALWAWLADRMLHQARDLHGLAFEAEAARDYNPPGRILSPPDVRLVADPASVTLTPRGPSATVRLQLSSTRGDGPVGLRFLAPAAGMPRVRPDFGRLEGAKREPPAPGWTDSLQPTSPAEPRMSLPVVLERPEASRALDATPRGILVQYQVAGWTFTSAVPVDMPDDPEPFRVILADPPDEPGDRLLVRPGLGPRSLPLRVWNPSGPRRSVVVELRAGEGAAPLLSSRLTVEAGAMQPLSFGQAALPQGRLPTLTVPLRFRVLDADRPEVVLGEQEVRAGVKPSSSYVQVEEIRYDPPRAVAGVPDRLAVRLRSRAMGSGPPCPVELFLDPGRIPGFLSAESGLFRGELTVDGKEKTLFAEGLRLAEGTDGPGTIALNVDGVPHAQTFLLRFARDGVPTTAERAIEVALTIRAPKAVRSGEPLAIVAEVDNAPEDATLELSLGRAEKGPFEPLVTRKLPTPRDGRVGFLAIGPGGSPHVEASLQDWSIEFPTAGIQGTYEARAQLRDADGREIASASRSVIIDDVPPRWVRLARLPRQAKRGTALEVRAAGQVPASGVREVVFFVGKPAPDGKLPAGAPTATGSPVPGAANSWSAKLPLPADPKGTIEVSVQMTSNVGLSRFDTGRVELIDTDPVPTGSIRGVVREAALPQSGLAVALLNAKGEKVLETKTDDDGIFSFADVPVGQYIVGSYKPTSMRVGRQPVEVKADTTVQVEVELLYQ